MARTSGQAVTTDPLVGFRDQAGDPKRGRGTGASRVYGALREEILCMKLAPGAALDEIGLSAQFGLSRSPVREALIRLAGEGLVVILPNRSTMVAPMDVQGLPDYLDALDTLQRATTRLAALRCDAAGLRPIKAGQLAFEKAVRRGIRKRTSLPIIEANHDFHMAIARAGGNAYFTFFYKRLLDEGRRMLHLHFEYHTGDEEFQPAVLTDEHAQIVDAIERHDVERADALAHSHVTQFKGRFSKYLFRNVTAAMRMDKIGAAPVARGL